MVDIALGCDLGDIRALLDFSLKAGNEVVRDREYRINIINCGSKTLFVAEVTFDDRDAALGERPSALTRRIASQSLNDESITGIVARRK
jgi:hypothetical protein